MHLMIAIALGIFGGFWLCIRWLEWRELWWERKELRQIRRQDRRAARERTTAEWARQDAERMAAQSPTRVRDCIAVSAAILAVYATSAAVLISLQ